MLPALEVQKKPYESSLAPKQTVDGVFCIHLTVLTGAATAVMKWFWTKECELGKKNARLDSQPLSQTDG